MSTSDLPRWGAIAAMLGGAFSILFVFLGEDNWAHVPVDAARFLFLAVGIVGLYVYLRRARGVGRLGTVGFYVCLFVFTLVAALDLGILINEAVERIYLALGPVRGPLLIVGPLLFGAGVLRSKSLPGGGAWLLIAAALTNVLGIVAMIISGGKLGAWVFIMPTVLFGLGWAWLGFGLWSKSSATSPSVDRDS